MSLLSRILNLFRREQLGAEIEDELAAHLAMRTEDNLAEGMSSSEARRDALVRFGNPVVVRERTSEADVALYFESVWADVRFALRQLRKSPAYTITALLALGLAIGANTAMFTAVNATLLRQLPFSEPSRVFHLENNWAAGLEYDFGSKDYEGSFNAAARSFKTIDSAAFYTSDGVSMVLGKGSSEHLTATEVTAGFLDVLQVKPQLGRAFRADEDIPGKDKVALVSDRLWRSQLAASPDALGRILNLNGIAFTIIGVMPPQMDFPSKTDIWAPTVFDTLNLREGGAFMTSAVVRVRDGVSADQMRAEFNARALQKRSAKGTPLTADQMPELTPIAAELTKSIRSSLLLLTSAVGLVLLIACANIAGLTLVRTAERRAELAVRAALGASSKRLIRQQLVESILLALGGGTLGVALAFGILKLLMVSRPLALDGFAPMSMDLPVLAFTAIIAMMTGLLFGIVPAWQAGHEDPVGALKTGAWRSSPKSTWTRQTLVAGEISLSFVLLMGAGLLMRTVINMNQVPLGYSTEGILSFSLSVHGEAYETNDHTTPALSNLYKRILDGLIAIPGVTQAAAVSAAPLETKADMLLPVSSTNTAKKASAAPRFASPGYFSVMGMTLLEGRDFSTQDTATSRKVVIITSDLAERLWPGRSPLGQALKCSYWCDQAPVVIGVVASSRRLGPLSDAYPEYYMSYTQQDWSSMTFVLRSAANPEIVAADVRHVVAAIDPTQPVYNLSTMQQRLYDKESLVRFEVFSLGIFAMLATLLAFIGLYGVISYTVTQRTREIGLRVALGAQRSVIRAALLRESLTLALVGAAIGVAASLGSARVLEAVLFGVSAHDPVTLASTALLFLVVALLATLVPAYRASRIDPMQALRAE